MVGSRLCIGRGIRAVSAMKERLKTLLQPKLADPAMERQYRLERRERLLPMLRYTAVAYLVINIVWCVLPGAGLTFQSWLFYRCNGIGSAIGYILCVFPIHRSASSGLMRHYDLMIAFWACHFLAFNSVTRGHSERLMGIDTTPEIYDQGYQLLVCSAWVAGFLAHAEVDLRYFILVIHWGVLIWTTLGVCLSMGLAGGLFLKVTMVYYVLCLFVCEQSRRAHRGGRAMWMLQKQFEKQAEQERAMAQAERDGVVAKVYQAEQAALHSFMAAVFDIFGRLVWRTSCEDDEPRLCFEDESNYALDELLQQPVAGKSLEALLGHPRDEDLWRRERHRLWEYAAIEATPQAGTGVDVNAHVVARKIGLTCTDAKDNTLEIELFIRPGTADSAIYGIFALQRGNTSVSIPVNVLDIQVPQTLAKTGRTRSVDSRSSGSSMSGVELPLPQEGNHGRVGEVFAWVDANSPGVPILKCSAGFTLLSGPSPVGSMLIDMFEEHARFTCWFQKKLNLHFVEDPSSPDQNGTPMQVEATWVRLHHVGSSASNLLELRAECTLDVDATNEGPDELDYDEAEIWPVLLVFRNVTQHRRKKPKRIPVLTGRIPSRQITQSERISPNQSKRHTMCQL